MHRLFSNLLKSEILRFHFFILATAFTSLIAAQRAPEDSGYTRPYSLLIQNAQIIDVRSGETKPGMDILIEKGTIKSIKKEIGDESATAVVNAQGKYVIPGLIDAHIHLFQSGGLYTRPDAVDLRDIQPYEDEIQWLKDRAPEILNGYQHAGITTVIDMGGPMYNYEIRSSYTDPRQYPDLFLTGPLISTYQPPEFAIADPPIIRVTNSEEARQQVLKQLPYSPDFIKIWYIVTPGNSAESTYDIVKAAIDESRSHGIRVAVHATQLNTAKLAIKAGADVLVHSVTGPIDQEFIEMMLANDVAYIPTLTVHGNYNLAFAGKLELDDRILRQVHPPVIASLIESTHIDHPFLKQLGEYADQFIEMDRRQDSIRKINLRMLSDAGVTISTGTDAGNIGTLHASSYYSEILSMAEAGLTNHEILKSSTYGAAHVINMNDSLGLIEEGFIANLVLLDENPLQDLKALLGSKTVIQNGQLAATDALLQFDSPEELAQRQLNAYNLRNIDAFLEPYSDSVRVYNFPDQLLYVGKEIMRNGYKSFFDQTPELHCKLLNRIVEGNTVIDHELVTGLPNGSTINAVAIYKIRDGEIAEVYFDRGQ